MQLTVNRLRTWTAQFLFCGYLFWVAKYGVFFFPGLWWIVAGMAIRVWAAAVINKRQELTTDGPYAAVRNPLYLGNFFVGLGFVLFLRRPWLTVLYAVGFCVLYYKTIREEEQLLRRRFGDKYIRYRQAVPAIIPFRFSSYRTFNPWVFSWSRLIANNELIRVCAVLFLLLFLHWVDRGVRCAAMSLSEHMLSAVAAMVLLIPLVYYRRQRARRHMQK